MAGKIKEVDDLGSGLQKRRENAEAQLSRNQRRECCVSLGDGQPRPLWVKLNGNLFETQFRSVKLPFAQGFF